MFLAKKSMPTVVWVSDMYISGLLEAIVDVLVDDTGFTHTLVAEEDDLELGLARHCADRVVHYLKANGL